MMRTRRMILIIQVALISICTHAQVTTEDIQQVLTKTARTDLSLQYPEYVKEFYNNYNYKCAWINNRSNTQYLLQLLEKAPVFGLDAEDYQFSFSRNRRSWTIPSSHSLKKNDKAAAIASSTTKGLISWLSKIVSALILLPDSILLRPACFSRRAASSADKPISAFVGL
jgi:Scaffold domain